MPAHLYPHFRPRTPQTAEIIRARCQAIASEYAARPFPENWYATTIGVLQAACYYGAENRHAITMYLFAKDSSKALNSGERWSLFAWVMPHTIGDDCLLIGCKETTDKWHCHNAVPQEIKNILEARLIEQGQVRMFEEKTT